MAKALLTVWPQRQIFPCTRPKRSSPIYVTFCCGVLSVLLLILYALIYVQVSHFYQYWSTAKVKGFEVYVCELDVDIEKCAERNIHKRSLDELKEVKLV